MGLERAKGQLPVHATHFIPVYLSHARSHTQTRKLVQPRYSAEGSHCSSDRRAPVKWLSLPGACVCVCVCFLPPCGYGVEKGAEGPLLVKWVNSHSLDICEERGGG